MKYFSSFFFGQGLGAAIGGLVVEQLALSAPGWFAAGTLVAGSLLAYWATPDLRASSSAPEAGRCRR